MNGDSGARTSKTVIDDAPQQLLPALDAAWLIFLRQDGATRTAWDAFVAAWHSRDAEIARLRSELEETRSERELCYGKYIEHRAERERLREVLVALSKQRPEDETAALLRRIAGSPDETGENPGPFAALKAQVQADHAYAWAWHCNLAMPFFDAGGDIDTANEGAARIMQMMFDVDTKSFPEWASRRRPDPNDRPAEKASGEPTDAEKRAMGVDLDSRDHEAR